MVERRNIYASNRFGPDSLDAVRRFGARATTGPSAAAIAAHAPGCSAAGHRIGQETGRLPGQLGKENAGPRRVASQAGRTEKDKTFKAETKFVGKAAYLKAKGATAQNLALLEMNIAGKQELHEKIIVTGQFIYQFAPADMKIYATEIPKPKAGQASQDNFLTLVFGATANDLRARYSLQLSNDKLHPDGEDKYYIYVDVVPKTAADKADFQRAQLVLSKDTFLPRRLWFEAPNKSEILWDITSIDDKNMPKRTDFDAPTPPPGWKLVPVDSKSELPPRIIRPEK